MLHDVKKNEHVKYLPEICLDKRFGFVIPRQWDNTAKGVVWSFNPGLAEDYKSLGFKQVVALVRYCLGHIGRYLWKWWQNKSVTE